MFVCGRVYLDNGAMQESKFLYTKLLPGSTRDVGKLIKRLFYLFNMLSYCKG